MAQKFPVLQARPTSPSSKRAIVERGDVRRARPVLGSVCLPADQVHPRHLPARPGARRLPHHRRVPAPVPRPGLPTLHNGQPNPAYDDVQVNGTPDGRVAPARGFLRRAYQGADATLGLVQSSDAEAGHDLCRVGPRLCAAVPGDRREQGAGRPGPALQAADVQLPPGHRRDHRQGEGVLGRRDRADLPEPGRPRPGGRRAAAGGCDRRGIDRRRNQGGILAR